MYNKEATKICNKTRGTNIHQLSHAMSINSINYSKQAIKPHGSEKKRENHMVTGFQVLHSKTLFDTSTHDSMQPNLSCQTPTSFPSNLYYFKKS